MNWHVFVPKSLSGSGVFWKRDSGLFCCGFEDLGHAVNAILLQPARDDDDPRVIRAAMDQLTDPEWWNGLDSDGVVFLSWGMPRYMPIARSIIAAGIRLIQITDTVGLNTPLVGPFKHFSGNWHSSWHLSPPLRAARTLMASLHGLFWDSWKRDVKRVRMQQCCDFFCASSPGAVANYRSLANFFGSRNADERIRLLPFPVSPNFGYGTINNKNNQVIAVGRWDSHQKRAPLLMDVIEIILTSGRRTEFLIFGKLTPHLQTWHEALPASVRAMVHLKGLVPNEVLTEAYQSSRVMLVSSAYEGCHISSAEALCCGASIVACPSPQLCVLEWHASHSSGQIAARDNAEMLAASLADELDAWDKGQRDPEAIARYWRSHFLPSRVVKQLLDFYGMNKAHENVDNESRSSGT